MASLKDKRPAVATSSSTGDLEEFVEDSDIVHINGEKHTPKKISRKKFLHHEISKRRSDSESSIDFPPVDALKIYQDDNNIDDDPNAGLQFITEDGRQLLKSGKLPRIVEWLINAVDKVQDQVLVAFFISYRQFTEPVHLFKLIVRYFQKCKDRGDETYLAESTAKLLHFLQYWLQTGFGRDFFENGESFLYEELLAFLNKISHLGLVDSANRMKLSLLRLKKERKADLLSKKDLKLSVVKLPPSKISFLELNVQELAEQLTLLESRMFRAIRSHEFLKLSWKSENRKEKSPHVVSMVDRFNMVSFWVATEIVFEKDLKSRVAILKKFIALAEKCLELRNFNTVMEILAGLNNVAVQRLKNTWNALLLKSKATLDELGNLMETKHNYKNYRDALIQTRKQAIVPYLGITLRDLTFIEEGNLDNVEGGFINFEKIQLLGDVILEVEHFQSKAYVIEETTMYSSFKKLVVFPDEVLYSHSLRAEPAAKN